MKTLFLIPLCALLIGCGTTGINDALITNGVSVATSVGLAQVHNAEQRHMIASLLQGYAPGLRTLTNSPTPEQLAALIQQYTPQNIKDQYPQVVAFATPLVINAVQTALGYLGKNATREEVVKIVNDVATGLENGSAGQ